MYPDSRRYSKKKVGKINETISKQLNWQSRSLQFVLSFLVALGLSYLIKDSSFIDVQNLNFYVLAIIFALFSVIFSNIMSNTTATIMIPLAISFVLLPP